MCVIALLCLVMGPLYSALPPSPDHSIFDYIGWMMSEGGHPYVSAVDQNWPGKMYIHFMSTRLFGNHFWSFRLFDYICLIAFCSAASLLVGKISRARVAFIFFPLYLLMYVSSGFWFAGQRDILSGHLLLIAGLLHLHQVDKQNRKYGIFTALCITGAILIKPLFIFFIPILLVFDLFFLRGVNRSIKQAIMDHVIIHSYLLLFFACLGIVSMTSGSFSAWLDIAVQFNLCAYVPDAKSYPLITKQFLTYMRISWHWYLLYSVCGLVALACLKEKKLIAIIAAIILTTVLSAYGQKKGFGYHLGPFLPVMGMLISIFIAYLYELAARKRWRIQYATIFALVVFIAIAGLGKKNLNMFSPQFDYYLEGFQIEELLSHYSSGETDCRQSEVLDAVKYIEETTAENDTVLTMGRAISINYLSERQLPIRFIPIPFLTLVQKGGCFSKEWSDEIRSAMAKEPPELIVLFKQPSDSGYTYLDNENSECIHVIRDFIEENYQLEKRFPHIDLFRIRKKADSWHPDISA